MVVTHSGLVIGQDELNRSGKTAITGSKPIIVPYKYFDRVKTNKIIYDVTDSRSVDEVLKHCAENALYLPYAKEMPNGYMTESLKVDEVVSNEWYEKIAMAHCYKVLALIVNRAVLYARQPLLEALVDWDFSNEAKVGSARIIADRYGFVANLKYYTIEISKRGYIQAQELAKLSDKLWEKDMILVDFKFTNHKAIRVASMAKDRWDDLEMIVETALRRHE